MKNNLYILAITSFFSINLPAYSMEAQDNGDFKEKFRYENGHTLSYKDYDDLANVASENLMQEMDRLDRQITQMHSLHNSATPPYDTVTPDQINQRVSRIKENIAKIRAELKSRR